MSKPPSSHLFDLVKSLTKSEKRYFKLYIQRKISDTNTKYMVLFNAMMKQKEYDESAIIKKNKSLNPRQVPNLKVELYNHILECLRIYHSESSSLLKLRAQLEKTEILHSKGLYPQARAMLNKARKLALKYDNNIALIDLAYWETYIHYQREDSSFELEQAALKNQIIHSELDKISRDLFDFYRLHGTARSQEDVKTIRKMSDHPVLKAKPAHDKLAFNTFGLYCHVNSTTNFLLGNYKDSIYYQELAVEQFLKNTHQIPEQLFIYTNILNNLAHAQRNVKMYNEALGTVDKIEETKKYLTYSEEKNLNYLLRIFLFSNSNKLKIFIETGEFKKGIDLIPEIQKGCEEFQITMRKDFFAEFHYLYSILYFGTGDYRSSLLNLNYILNSSEDGLRVDLFSFARILNLIIHFELGNNELLDYAIKSTYRFLKKKNRLYRFEISIFEFIKRLPKISDPEDLQNEFKKLKSKLVDISQDNLENIQLLYFDFISWLDSKIENISFEEAVKRNLREHYSKMKDQ